MTEPPSQHPPAPVTAGVIANAPRERNPFSLRAIVIAITLTVAVLALVEYSELVTPTSQMSEATPPIPAILGLGVVWFLTWLWRTNAERLSQSKVGLVARAGRFLLKRTLTQKEILVVYLFLIVSCAMPSVGIVRLILPCLMALQYFGTPQNNYELMATAIPRHWAPLEGEAVRTFWEGVSTTPPASPLNHIPVIGGPLEGIYQFFAQTVNVPWDQWAAPFIIWSIYLIAYFVSSFCLVCLFRRHWAEEERLQFPLADLSISMVSTGSSPGTGRPFFRDPVMWTGFALAVIYNGMNMLHVFNPAVPAMGLNYPIGRLFTENPWRAMNGLAIWYKPEIMGMAYLVPNQILLSILVFSLMQWFSRPVARIIGHEPPGFPMSRVQATGALIVLGAYFTYQARHHLRDTVRKALRNTPAIDDSDEPVSYRWAFWGTVIGLLIVVGFPIVQGVDWWMAFGYFGVGTLLLIAYCRNRAETGLPIVWGYPLRMQKQVMNDFFGSQPFIEPGRFESFTRLSVFSFLQRGTYYAITSTEQESCTVGETMGLGGRRTAGLLTLAVIIGFTSTMWMYLASYYTYGGNVMETVGGTSGGQRVRIALGEFEKASRWLSQPYPPNLPGIAATLVGAAVTIALILGRRAFISFPLHPIGYALACCHDNYMWFVALVVLTAKLTLMRIGGLRLYRRMMPGFIAFTLGHFVSIGIWAIVGLFAGEDVQRYRVWFL